MQDKGETHQNNLPGSWKLVSDSAETWSPRHRDEPERVNICKAFQEPPATGCEKEEGSRLNLFTKGTSDSSLLCLIPEGMPGQLVISSAAISRIGCAGDGCAGLWLFPSHNCCNTKRVWNGLRVTVIFASSPAGLPQPTLCLQDQLSQNKAALYQ